MRFKAQNIVIYGDKHTYFGTVFWQNFSPEIILLKIMRVDVATALVFVVFIYEAFI